MLSTFPDRREQWIMIIVDINHLWIDARIGNNVMSQRFYISTPSLERILQNEIIFGYGNYSGCVRQIEVGYNQVYSILLTDQLIELNENQTVGCKR